MPRPNYREQDGCWNCEQVADVGSGEQVLKCIHEDFDDGVEPYAICDDWTKEVG